MILTSNNIFHISSFIIVSFLFSCGKSTKTEHASKFAPPVEVTYEQAIEDWENNIGIGPIMEIQLDELNETLAKTGSALYQEKCTACHEPDKDKLGPAPEGVMTRRTPEWIMNMILNPLEMATNDPIAKGLFKKYNTIMTDQKLTEEEARAVLEYFRTL